MTVRAENRNAAGFTLLELLVALIVFGLILVGLSEGLRLGFRAWSAQSRTVALTADLEVVHDTLGSLVATAEPADIRGDTNHLALISSLRLLGRGQMADVALFASNDRLVLRWRPHPPGQPLGPALTMTDIDVVAGIADAAFAYLPRGGADGWQTVWNSADPPALIRLRLRFNDGRQWPSLILAPLRTQLLH